MGRSCRKRTHSRGFSLIELMIVVVITGILAAIAIPTFSGYVAKSRTSEATQFLGVIKLREEAYRSEFGRYAVTFGTAYDSSTYPPGAGDFIPDTAANMRGKLTAWPAGNAAWNQLGAKPDGFVRFGYVVSGGAPGTTPDPSAWSGDHWFIAQAVADLDGDGPTCTFEMYSESKNIWYSPPKGWE